MKNKIIIVCPHLSSNTFVRTFLLVNCVRDDYALEVYGCTLNGVGIYPFFRDANLKFKTVTVNKYADTNFLALLNLLKRAKGDMCHVSSGILSGILSSYYISKHMKIPILLDIFDYDVPTIPVLQILNIMKIKQLFFNEVITSTRMLQRLVGGTYIPTPVDTEFFDPHKYESDKSKIRRQYGIDDGDVVIGFVGTPNPWKGLEYLIRAYNKVKTKSTRLIFIGARRDTPYVAELMTMADPRTIFIEPVPHSIIPKYYALCDVVVIPQTSLKYAIFQIPAKLFEAMSMAKAIISTDVGDIPEILNGAGKIVKAMDINRLAEALSELIIDENERKRLGKAARKRCIENYSYKVITKSIKNVYKNLMDGV